MRISVAKPLLLVVVAGSSAFTSAAATGGRSLQAEPVAANPPWVGPQFVRSDRAGKVYFFRGDKPEAYPLLKSGELGPPQRLQALSEPLGHVQNAVLSPSGKQWLVLAEGTVRLFVDGKEKPLPPLAWQPWMVGFLRDTPVVGVMPRPLPEAVLRIQQLGTVPWLLTLDTDRWAAMAEHNGLSAATAWSQRHRMNDWVAEYASFLAPARDGKLWVASQYGYRVRRFSAGGKRLLEIVSEKEKKETARPTGTSAAPPPAVAATMQRIEAQGGKPKFRAFTAEQVIADVVEGYDHRAYLLVAGSGENALALDRYDPVRGVVERTPLAIKGSGRLTLAAGKDGLYVAPFNAPEGVWLIPWGALESAVWKEVEGAEIRGGAS